MKNTTKGRLLMALAVLLDVGAPLAATLTQFPIWIDRSAEATFSGMFVVLGFISILPFLKQIKAYFRSPAIWTVWLILFLLFFAMRSIVNEMIIVCFVGFVANLIGTIVYRMGKKISKRDRIKGEE